MKVEATEMRRSTLQRKDRDELTQIAGALGVRPPSRARKEEIIQLILDQAVDSDGLPVLGAGRGAKVAAKGLDLNDPAAGAVSGRDAAGAGSADSKASSDRTSRTDDAPMSEGDDRRAVARGREEREDGERARDDVEPGNRRRRRRGRDRDRDKDEGWNGDPITVDGYLDLRDEGYGFLRVDGSLPNKKDAYVPVKTIRQYGLRRGDHLTGTSRPANRTERNPALLSVASINDGPPELRDRPRFERLTPVHAERRLELEQSGEVGPGDLDPAEADGITARLIDLVAPIGIGQRVLVIAPPHSGATALLTAIMQSIETNEPDLHVMALLLDQRPEEISEIDSYLRSGDVAATGFDQPPEEHVLTAEMTIERAKRRVEAGQDVVVIVDGLTALARAYNSMLSNSGRAFSGHVESGAIHMPKKLFGAGRNIVDGGSLTMIATLTAQNRSFDEILVGTFAGTANTEIHLDRWAAELGVHPAIDLTASVSRDEQRFVDESELDAIRKLRADLASGDGPGAVVAQLEAALARLRETSNNADLLR